MTIHISVGAFCCLYHGKVHLALSRKDEVCDILCLPRATSTLTPICADIGFDPNKVIYNYDLDSDLALRNDKEKVTCSKCIEILKRNGY